MWKWNPLDHVLALIFISTGQLVSTGAHFVVLRIAFNWWQISAGEYPRIFPNFQNCAHCEKDLKDNKDNSRYLGRKHARIFVHCLFLVAQIFPRASLSENCSLLGTDNVRGQVSEHIFAPNGDYCLFIIRQIFSLARDWSKGVTWPNIPQLKLGNIREYSPIFKTARVAKEIWKIIKTIVAIMGENMLGCLSLDIISSS